MTIEIQQRHGVVSRVTYNRRACLRINCHISGLSSHGYGRDHNMGLKVDKRDTIVFFARNNGDVSARVDSDTPRLIPNRDRRDDISIREIDDIHVVRLTMRYDELVCFGIQRNLRRPGGKRYGTYYRISREVDDPQVTTVFLGNDGLVQTHIYSYRNRVLPGRELESKCRFASG